MNERINMYIYKALIRQESSEALAAEEMTFESVGSFYECLGGHPIL